MRSAQRVLSAAGAGLVVMLAACGAPPQTREAGDAATSSSGPAPAAVLTAEALSAWDGDVHAFVERFNAGYRDAEIAFAEFTEDAAVIDPTSGDHRIAPKSAVVTRWDAFIREFPDYTVRSGRGYLDLAAGAYPTEVGGLPAEVAARLPDGLLHELRVFRFADELTARATTFELWYRLQDEEAVEDGCLVPGGCGPEVRDLVDRYLAAWSGRDPAAIEALYRPDATFVDGLLGIEASGSTEIGDLPGRRFGIATQPACAPVDIYVQINGGDPTTTGNPDPDGGKIAGVALVYSCGVGTDVASRPVDSVSLLLLGTRSPGDGPARLDPDGVIVSEQVLHDPATLTAAAVRDDCGNGPGSGEGGGEPASRCGSGPPRTAAASPQSTG